MENRNFIVLFVVDIIKEELKKNILWEEPNDLKEHDPFSFDCAQYFLKHFSVKDYELILFASQNPKQCWTEKEINKNDISYKKELEKFQLKYDDKIQWFIKLSTHQNHNFICYYPKDFDKTIRNLNSTNEINVEFKLNENLDSRTLIWIVPRENLEFYDILLNYLENKFT